MGTQYPSQTCPRKITQIISIFLVADNRLITVSVFYIFAACPFLAKKPFTTCLKPCPLKLEQHGMQIKSRGKYISGTGLSCFSPVHKHCEASVVGTQSGIVKEAMSDDMTTLF